MLHKGCDVTLHCKDIIIKQYKTQKMAVITEHHSSYSYESFVHDPHFTKNNKEHFF